MNTQLRLLLFPDCNRKCEKCCNKQYDIAGLPICNDYTPYETIMLTGGEPMLKPNMVKQVIDNIRLDNSNAKIYLYTAKVEQLEYLLPYLDGITLTLHDNNDVVPFIDFEQKVIAKNIDVFHKSLKLCVFDEVNLYVVPRLHWNIKDNIHWLDDCPLPKNEDFMRYKGE